MEQYHIAPVGNEFHVVEMRPDGRNSTVGGFSTEAAAKGWLDSFMVLIGLMDCLAGSSTRDRFDSPLH